MTSASINPKPQQTIPRIYTLSEIETVVSTPQFATRLIDVIQEGFVSYSQGKFNACPIQTMGAPPLSPFSSDADTCNHDYSAQTCVKSGYITSSSHYIIKVASGGHPFPSNSGLMQLYSQQSGKLETILLDDGLLTELRTAAAGAVAAKLLAPNLTSSDEVKLEDAGDAVEVVDVDTKCIGILGTGVQARYQLRYLAHVTNCRRVLVWGRTKSNVQAFIDDMKKEGWDVRAVGTSQELLEPKDNWSCPLIVTTTSSREPLLKDTEVISQGKEAKNKKQQLHITCIGSDSTGKIELDPKLVAKADLLVADSRLQTKERGEFEESLGQGLVTLENVVELGELVPKKELHRKKDGKDWRFTIFDSSGVAVQDCVIAMMVNEALSKKS